MILKKLVYVITMSLCVGLLNISNQLYAQKICMRGVWVNQSKISVESICRSWQGETYVFGSFGGTMVFGTDTLQSSTKSKDLFVAKIDEKGDYTWGMQLGCTNKETPKDISMDYAGNIYVTGYFMDTATFGSNQYISNGSADLFVAKLNQNKLVEWVVQSKGYAGEYGLRIKCDSIGNSYVLGELSSSTAIFGPDTFNGVGLVNTFVTKVDTGGKILWGAGMLGNGKIRAGGLAMDKYGNCYATGYFADSANFGKIRLIASDEDIFLVKLSTQGKYFWAKKYGGSSGSDNASDLDMDKHGNCYITGFFTGITNYGSFNLNAISGSDILILKIDSSGVCKWVKQAGGYGNEGGAYIKVSSEGSSYVAGNYAGTASFGSYTVKSAGNSDGFVCVLDKGGSFMGVFSFGGTGGDGVGKHTLDKDFNILTMISHTNQGVFDTITYGSNTHKFIGKISADSLYARISPITSIVCGDSVQVNTSAIGISRMIWSPTTGINLTDSLSPYFSPLTTTKYTMTAIGHCGDTLVKSFTINVKPLKVTAVASNQNILCNQSTILTASTNMNSDTNVKFNWTPAIGLDDSTSWQTKASPTQTTTYFINSINPLGCSSQDQVTINVAPFTVSANPIDSEIICGEKTKVLASTNLNSDSDLVFQWSHSKYIDDSTISNPSVFPISNTQYNVKVTSMNGCVGQASARIYVSPYSLQLLADTANIMCGEKVSLLSKTNLQNDSNILWRWSPGNILIDSTIYNPTARPTNSTFLKVKATTQTGCYAEDSISIKVVPYTLNVASIRDTIVCGDTIRLRARTSLKNDSSIQFIWSPTTGLDNNLISNPVANPAVTTSYTVSANSNLGCKANQQYNLVVKALEVSFSKAIDTITIGGSVQLNPYSNQQNKNILNCLWKPSKGLDKTNILNPIASPDSTTEYTLITTTLNGCVDTSKTTVVVQSRTGISLMNAKHGVNIYPNPNQGSFTLDLINFDAQVVVRVIDISGREVKYIEPANHSNLNINLEVPSGIYFCEVSDGAAKIRLKLIVL